MAGTLYDKYLVQDFDHQHYLEFQPTGLDTYVLLDPKHPVLVLELLGETFLYSKVRYWMWVNRLTPWVLGSIAGVNQGSWFVPGLSICLFQLGELPTTGFCRESPLPPGLGRFFVTHTHTHTHTQNHFPFTPTVHLTAPKRG